MIENIPTKGVKLSDIIEDCGGLVDGADTFAGTGWDGWSGPPTPGFFGMSIDGYMDPNTMIAIEQFGEPIELIDGGPAYLIVPGGPAFAGSKWIQGNQLLQGRRHRGYDRHPVGAAHFLGNLAHPLHRRAGVQGRPAHRAVRRGLHPGRAGRQQGDRHQDQRRLRRHLDRDPLPQNMDVDQWVKWTATWTPEVAGTYCLTLHTNGEHRRGPQRRQRHHQGYGIGGYHHEA